MESPYRLAASYYRNLGLNPYVYGHTPLWSIYKIFKRINLKQHAKVLDLGAGNFHAAFFLRKAFNFHVIGIEKVPIFCEKAKALKNQLSIENIEVHQGNYFEYLIPDADCAFLFGSNLDDEDILKLIRNISHLKLVVTVSFPLSDYSNQYDTVDHFELPFVFGLATVYFNQRKNYGTT
jgi:precorrin-6B methylase 2